MPVLEAISKSAETVLSPMASEKQPFRYWETELHITEMESISHDDV